MRRTRLLFLKASSAHAIAILGLLIWLDFWTTKCQSLLVLLASPWDDHWDDQLHEWLFPSQKTNWQSRAFNFLFIFYFFILCPLPIAWTNAFPSHNPYKKLQEHGGDCLDVCCEPVSSVSNKRDSQSQITLLPCLNS